MYKREEMTLICLSASDGNPKVIRAAAALAKAFGGGLTALYVEPQDYQSQPQEDKKHLSDHIKLAESLGASVTTLFGNDTSAQIAEYARVSGATRIVLGLSPARNQLSFRNSLLKNLYQRAPDIDFFIIPTTDMNPGQPHFLQRNREMRPSEQLARHAYRTGFLLETSQMLQKAGDEVEILSVAAGQLVRLMNRTVVVYPVNDGIPGAPMFFAQEENDTLSSSGNLSLQAAELAVKHGTWTGAGTEYMTDAPGLFIPVKTSNGIGAVFGIAGMRSSDMAGQNPGLVIAVLNECGIMLDNYSAHLQRRYAEDKAKREELRANLLRSISHDLRTPLTAISGNAALLRTHSGDLSEEKKLEIYDSIESDAVWLNSLVENLLSITRIDRGRSSLNLQPELVSDVIEEALEHVDRRSSKHDIQFIPDDLFLVAQMDARLIMQVVINLVNNAVKYTQSGSHIRISVQPRGNNIVVAVADDGPGIDSACQKQIFDMFYTGENVNSDGRRGLGLGLALCKSIIEAHKGTIEVRNNNPAGTVFSFTLPAAQIKEEQYE